jgi:hypothetical protein
MDDKYLKAKERLLHLEYLEYTHQNNLFLMEALYNNRSGEPSTVVQAHSQKYSRKYSPNKLIETLVSLRRTTNMIDPKLTPAGELFHRKKNHNWEIKEETANPITLNTGEVIPNVKFLNIVENIDCSDKPRVFRKVGIPLNENWTLIATENVYTEIPQEDLGNVGEWEPRIEKYPTDTEFCVMIPHVPEDVRLKATPDRTHWNNKKDYLEWRALLRGDISVSMAPESRIIDINMSRSGQ